MARSWQMLLADTITISTAFIYPTKEALAQNITTDGTVGTPQNLTGPNYNIPQSLGQTVNSNLFHSFGKFNLDSNEAAIFQSGNEINNIFSRVTGGSPSSINGLIRTLGQDVNLFFLNPNGIIFGENASLDVSGSFLATTADSFVFGDGLEFSATNPQAAPLLTVNLTPGLQYGQNNPSGTIINQGNLTVGQNLELLAGNLDLQGQLQAGQNLILQGDTIKIRDSVTNPFIAAAGNELLIQGNESIDIFALNHPHSGLFSGGDMKLSSANPVIGDIHFWSGGNFQIKQLDGNLGNLHSPYDPVIRASGDVSFDSYEGASLHIFAGGSVTVSGDINITSADTVGNSIQEQVTLSDGETVVDINGNTEPTLDIRAGTTAFGQPGIIGSTDGFSNLPNTEGHGTSADINIQNITNNGGLVFLTNQHQPDSNLSGEITIVSIDTSSNLGGGNVFIDSRDGITVNSLINVSGGDIATLDFLGNGGNISLLANHEIIINSGSLISSSGLLGGTINFKSKGDIFITGSTIQNASFTTSPRVTGGDINITANTLSIEEDSLLFTTTFEEANSGNIILNVNETTSLEGFNTFIITQVQPKAIGNGGDLRIETQNLFIDEAVIGVDTYGNGNAGDVTIKAEQFRISRGGQINNRTFSNGNTGNLTVESQSVEVIGRTFDNSNPTGLAVRVEAAEAIGNGGDLTIKTENLLVADGAKISATTFGVGDAGNLIINAKSVEVIGESVDAVFSSGLFAQADRGSSGNGGNLIIDTEHLLVKDGAEISVSTLSSGNAGNLIVKAELVEVTGESANPDAQLAWGLFAQATPGSTGNGGNLTIDTKRLLVKDGSQIGVATWTSGDAGNLTVKAESVEVVGRTNNGIAPSGLFTQVNPEAKGNGGDLTINTETLKVIDGAVVSASTFGNGDAGNIVVTANSLETSNGGQIITNTSGDNSAGNITLEIFDSVTLTGSDSGIFANTQEGSSGNGGSILTQNQTPQTVLIKDGATIAVNSDGSGQGGSITLAAKELTLDNGSITAETTSNQGGNIILDIGNILRFDNIGEITTTAGTAQAGGDGGNVTINADFILAFPTDKTYEITANAFEGDGGNIEITTNSFFGREFVNISASSQFGLEGDVSIDILEIDPTKGLTELPANVIDASQQITQGCTPQESGRFVATGRGGLPLSPNEPLRGTAVITNWVDEPTETTRNVNNQLTRNLAEDKSNSKIIEAQRWIINDRGNVELVTELPANPAIPINVPCNSY